MEQHKCHEKTTHGDLLKPRRQFSRDLADMVWLGKLLKQKGCGNIENAQKRIDYPQRARVPPPIRKPGWGCSEAASAFLAVLQCVFIFLKAALALHALLTLVLLTRRSMAVMLATMASTSRKYTELGPSDFA